ncbi:MAG TPA: polymer-forming cytoskeletal protein [Polyangiaceae bacterium]|jgi:cytoskeletal protein CcmA (bactofilin family)|nr:polymer-forming cytoskeletal protein [Polyangiaceae bacterium]
MDDPKTTELSRLTVVEEGTELRGSLTSTCPVVVRGSISGDIASPTLTVAPTGSVSGRVKVEALASHGTLAGEIDADRAQVSGRVLDGAVLRARTLDIKLDAEGKMTVAFGQAKLEVGDEPDR